MRRLWQICWCPPKGICQAGKDMNIMPLSDKKSFNLIKSAVLSAICSNTSWQMMISNFWLRLLNLNISEAKKRPWAFASRKKSFASLIRHSAMSIPVTLQPNVEKGNKLPPSPQPISKIFILGFYRLILFNINIGDVILFTCRSKFLKIQASVFLSFLHKPFFILYKYDSLSEKRLHGKVVILPREAESYWKINIEWIFIPDGMKLITIMEIVLQIRFHIDSDRREYLILNANACSCRPL